MTLDEAFRAGKAEERRMFVEWLRSMARDEMSGGDARASWQLGELATMAEKGEHTCPESRS